MLVLSRYPNQSLLIPEIGVEIKILATQPNGKVSLGIDAPKDLLILRNELHIEEKEVAENEC